MRGRAVGERCPPYSLHSESLMWNKRMGILGYGGLRKHGMRLLRLLLEIILDCANAERIGIFLDDQESRTGVGDTDKLYILYVV